MSRELVRVARDDSIEDAAERMSGRRVGSALVFDGERLVGILTERDVLRAAASGKDLTASAASEWMTRDPETAEPGMDAEEAAALMLSKGFRHLPVCDDDAGWCMGSSTFEHSPASLVLV